MVTTIRCPKCGTLSDEGVDFCPNCDTFLPWTDATARSRPSAGIELAVSATQLAVTPGGEASLELMIRNSGRNVDRVSVDIEGVADGWTVVEPGTMSLLPDAGGLARLVVRPPRDARIPAGRHLLELHARSAIDPTVDVEQRVSVEVAPFDDLRVRMTPPTSRGTSEAFHRVVVENGGNHPVTVALHGRDREGAGEVSVTLEPSVVQLDGGASAAVTAVVRPSRPLADGPARPRPFLVVAQAAGHGETILDGVMIQEPAPAAPPVPPAAPVAVMAAPRKRRRWPIVVALIVLLAGLAGTAITLAPRDADDAAPPAAGPEATAPAVVEQEEPPVQDDEVAALPDLSIAAVQCALVPEAGELRFAVQIANGGAAVEGPVTISAVAGDLQGSTEVAVDGLATGVFGVPVDDELLGTELEFTIAIDPGEAVEETDEGNNAGVVTIILPPAAAEPVSLCG